jgi:hypothetical protein
VLRSGGDVTAVPAMGAVLVLLAVAGSNGANSLMKSASATNANSGDSLECYFGSQTVAVGTPVAN